MEDNQPSNQEQTPTEVNFSIEQQSKIDGMLEDAKKQWENEFLNPVISERDNLIKFKPVEKSDIELQLELREKELFQKEINYTLKESELEDFSEFFHVHSVEELQQKITNLSTILNERQIKNSYVPENHKSQSQYEQAQSKGNVQDMISAKLGKVFGK